MACNCPPNDCAECVEPASTCIYRLDGVVDMIKCEHCSPEALGTWHHNGKCLRCGKFADGMTPEDDRRFNRQWDVSPPMNNGRK